MFDNWVSVAFISHYNCYVLYPWLPLYPYEIQWLHHDLLIQIFPSVNERNYIWCCYCQLNITIHKGTISWISQWVHKGFLNHLQWYSCQIPIAMFYHHTEQNVFQRQIIGVLNNGSKAWLNKLGNMIFHSALLQLNFSCYLEHPVLYRTGVVCLCMRKCHNELWVIRNGWQSLNGDKASWISLLITWNNLNEDMDK